MDDDDSLSPILATLSGSKFWEQELRDNGGSPTGKKPTRRHGGGRQRLEKTQPGITRYLAYLIKSDPLNVGDSPFWFSNRPLRQLAKDLKQWRYRVCFKSIATLLSQMEYKRYTGTSNKKETAAILEQIKILVFGTFLSFSPVLSVSYRVWRLDPLNPNVATPDGRTRIFDPKAVLDGVRIWWKNNKVAFPRASCLLLVVPEHEDQNPPGWEPSLSRLKEEVRLHIQTVSFPAGVAKWKSTTPVYSRTYKDMSRLLEYSIEIEAVHPTLDTDEFFVAPDVPATSSSITPDV